MAIFYIAPIVIQKKLHRVSTKMLRSPRDYYLYLIKVVSQASTRKVIYIDTK